MTATCFPSALVILVLLLSGFSTGCTEQVYIGESPEYVSIKGNSYRLLVDCLVVEHTNRKNRSKYPQISCNIDLPGIGSSFLPKDISASDIGKVYNDLRVINYLKEGTILTVLNIREEKSVEMRLVYFEVSVQEEDGLNAVYDVIRPLDKSKHPYDIHIKVAKEITANSNGDKNNF